MSRVGKNPVSIPQGVECSVANNTFNAKGKLGSLVLPLSKEIKVAINDGKIVVTPLSNSKAARMMWGTTQRLVSNVVVGVNEGFAKRLEINGVGYRAQMQGTKLVLNLGFSHDVIVEVPSDIKVVCEKPTLLVISGANRQKVGEFAANIRGYRPPEPYKGKGVKYEGEFILRKEGKKK